MVWWGLKVTKKVKLFVCTQNFENSYLGNYKGYTDETYRDHVNSPGFSIGKKLIRNLNGVKGREQKLLEWGKKSGFLT